MDHNDAVESHAVERYWLGELEPPQREEFEEHFFVCPICEEALSVTEALEANARESAAGKNPNKGSRLRWTWVPVSIAAALLAGVVGVDRLVEIPRYQRQIAALSVFSAPRAVEPVLLHAGQRRGTETTPTALVSKDSPVYLLEFDVPGDKTEPEYDCTIETSSGTKVATLTHLVPRAGLVTIQLNAENTPPGDYKVLLSKHDSKPADLYDFSVRYR